MGLKRNTINTEGEMIMRRICMSIVLLSLTVCTALAMPEPTVELNGDTQVNGYVNAKLFLGDGSELSGLSPGNITPGTANINITGNAASATTAVTVMDNAIVPAKIAFYDKVAIVALSGGDYSNPATAMSNYLIWCGTPSASNPCLLKIMPGVYNIGATTVVMRPYLDIEGSGENTTRITGNIDSSSSGIVNGASNSEIRFLTVENLGGGSSSIAISNSSASPKITNVSAVASGGSDSTGILNSTASPVMTNVTATASGGTQNFGVHNINASSSPVMVNVITSASGGTSSYGIFHAPSTSMKMINVTATASGGTTNYGVYTNGSSLTMMNVVASASGGSNNYGVYYRNSPSLTMTNVMTTATGGTNSYGVYNDSSSPVMMGVVAIASGGTNSYGVYNTGSGTIKINHSRIQGTTGTICNEAGATTFVGNTQMDGGAPYNNGTLTCAGVYDENYTFYANTCP